MWEIESGVVFFKKGLSTSRQLNFASYTFNAKFRVWFTPPCPMPMWSHLHFFGQPQTSNKRKTTKAHLQSFEKLTTFNTKKQFTPHHSWLKISHLSPCLRWIPRCGAEFHATFFCFAMQHGSTTQHHRNARHRELLGEQFEEGRQSATCWWIPAPQNWVECFWEFYWRNMIPPKVGSLGKQEKEWWGWELPLRKLKVRPVDQIVNSGQDRA